MKQLINKVHLISTLLLALTIGTYAQNKPVNPNSSPEAVKLLEYIYSISGKQTLAGQHCAPVVGDTRLAVVHRQTGKYTPVFGQDFGFSYPGYWDGINYRQRIVDDAIFATGMVLSLRSCGMPLGPLKMNPLRSVNQFKVNSLRRSGMT